MYRDPGPGPGPGPDPEFLDPVPAHRVWPNTLSGPGLAGFGFFSYLAVNKAIRTV